jgi:hypothetical protein
VRDNGEEINSLKEENRQLKEQTLMQTTMTQKLNEMLHKKQVEIAELQSHLQSQLQLKQEGEKDVVLLLEKKIQLLKLFEDKMDLYRLRNEIGPKVDIDLQKTNMDLEETINSMKTLLETTAQTRKQVSQTDFKPTTVEIMEKADTAFDESDYDPLTVETLEKSGIALLEAKNIIAEFEKQAKNEEAIQAIDQSSRDKAEQPPKPNLEKKKIVPKVSNAVVRSYDETESEKNRIRSEILRLAEIYYRKDMETKDKKMKIITSQLNQSRNNTIDTLSLILKEAKKDKFIDGGSKASRRHGKRIKSHKPHSYKNKNKTKTRRYRKRSFTRRRK